MFCLQFSSTDSTHLFFNENFVCEIFYQKFCVLSFIVKNFQNLNIFSEVFQLVILSLTIVLSIISWREVLQQFFKQICLSVLNFFVKNCQKLQIFDQQFPNLQFFLWQLFCRQFFFECLNYIFLAKKNCLFLWFRQKFSKIAYLFLAVVQLIVFYWKLVFLSFLNNSKLF